MNHNRDGVDTTGGFKDCTVYDSFFINNNVAAFDFKTLLVFESDLNPNVRNENISISNCEFIADGNTTIVTTLLNRGDFPNVESYAPNNITITGCIFENVSIGTGWQASWLISGDTTGPARSAQPDSYYQGLAGPDWSAIQYPLTGTPVPFFSSGLTASVQEGLTTPFHTAMASNTTSFSISGTDASFFNIDAITGDLSFIAAPNFSAPQDGNSDNIYDLIITASGAGGSTPHPLAVTVTDDPLSNPAPVFSSPSQITVLENTPNIIYTAIASDTDTIAWSGPDIDWFDVDDDVNTSVSFLPPPNFEDPNDSNADNVYELTATASGPNGTTVLDITITVTNDPTDDLLDSQISGKVARWFKRIEAA